MDQKIIRLNFLFWAIPLCIITSVILTSFLSFSIKNEIVNDLKGIQFVMDSNEAFNASLYYTTTNSFEAQNTLLDINIAKDTALFMLPTTSKPIKNFRLDFGNDKNLKKVKLNSLQLLFKEKIISHDSDYIFKNLYLNSSSTSLDNRNSEILINEGIEPFDPYIVFLPIVEFTGQTPMFVVLLLFPFLLLTLSCLVIYRLEYTIKVLDILLLLLIVSIPLKIAWTTFSALLLCAYGIYESIKNKRVNLKNWNFVFFIAVFLLLMMFGRPSSFNDIGKESALLLFAVLAVTIKIPIIRTYWLYGMFFLFFNALVTASIISFLIWFNDFYGLTPVDYFKEIKIYSGRARDWLMYYHASFLSFFGLIGLLFMHKLLNKQELGKTLLVLYHVLLLTFIILVGARICLLIYFVFLLNLLVQLNYKQRILINSGIFIVVTLVLTLFVKNLDQNRYHLWAVSWEAVKEKPYFGYGLGMSDEMLLSDVYLKKAGFSKSLDLNHSHNQFITFLLETGIIGFLTISIIFVFLLYKTKLYRSKNLVLFLIGLAYIFLTESILRTSKPLYVICFLFLLLTSISEIEAKGVNKIETRK